MCPSPAGCDSVPIRPSGLPVLKKNGTSAEHRPAQNSETTAEAASSGGARRQVGVEWQVGMVSSGVQRIGDNLSLTIRIASNGHARQNLPCTNNGVRSSPAYRGRATVKLLDTKGSRRRQLRRGVGLLAKAPKAPVE